MEWLLDINQSGVYILIILVLMFLVVIYIGIRAISRNRVQNEESNEWIKNLYDKLREKNVEKR